MTTATCIGCGCDDFHACEDGCYWLRVDYADKLGVCSSCEEHVETWDRRDRTPHAQPIAELEDPKLSRIPRPDSPKRPAPCNTDHDWPFEDVQDSDQCRRCGMSFVRHIFTEMP